MQVRRTRISERIRKLQDLVPNMEKVTEPISKVEIDRTVQLRFLFCPRCFCFEEWNAVCSVYFTARAP
jgi:hypothetical protein